MTVTNLKPDIVIIDETKKTVYIVEITVPFETNISARHTYKTDKYAHFITDITNYKATVTAVEVGAPGYLTTDNIARLKYIHTKCKKTVTKNIFVEDTSKLAITGSYYLFNARKDPMWSEPGYITPQPPKHP